MSLASASNSSYFNEYAPGLPPRRATFDSFWQTPAGGSGTARRNASDRFRSKIRQKRVVGGIPSLDVFDADREQAYVTAELPALVESSFPVDLTGKQSS
jgi:hypothetical protein